MKKKVLTRRYGLGLINTLKDGEDFRKVGADLSAAAGLLGGSGEAASFLSNPFYAKMAKIQVVEEILDKAGSDRRVRNFIRLLLEKGRFELLPEIVSLLPELWNDRTGIVTVDVASAVPLSEPQRSALKAALEAREGRPVSPTFRVDPGLIGGLSLRKGNEVMDLSLKGRLERLRDLLSEN